MNLTLNPGETLTTFKLLSLNSVFIFTSQRQLPNSGMALGPWVKVTTGKYRKVGDTQIVRVGSSRVPVIKLRDKQEAE